MRNGLMLIQRSSFSETEKQNENDQEVDIELQMLKVQQDLVGVIQFFPTFVVPTTYSTYSTRYSSRPALNITPCTVHGPDQLKSH